MAKRDKKQRAYQLNFRLTDFINSSLTDDVDVSGARHLPCCMEPQVTYQGVTPGYSGFVLLPNKADRLIKQDANAKAIVRPYLIGRELMSGNRRPRRYLIDVYGHELLQLNQYPACREHLVKHVLPAVRKKVDEVRRKNPDMVKPRQEHLSRWWTFWAQRDDLRQWMSTHKRIISASRTQRWPFAFEFISTDILPGDKLQLFALEDDYSFGVIQSSAHCLWYRAKGARLKNEVDYNYSSDSVFETFPWPQRPSRSQVAEVATLGREVRRLRESLLPTMKKGLREIYESLQLEGRSALKKAHLNLDKAVLAAFGFNEKRSVLGQLLDLNNRVATAQKDGQRVTSPGLPVAADKGASFVSDDCVKP